MKPREEQFRQLYERYSNEVHSFCVRRVGRAAADDAAAEVFTVVWRRLHGVELDAERAWIYGIARNVIRNQWRAASRKDRLAGRIRGTRQEEPKQPEDLALLIDEKSAVLRAIDRLRSADREVLVLSAWEELTGPEIAQVLGISTNTVRQRLHRAKKRLAKELDDVAHTLNSENTRGGQA